MTTQPVPDERPRSLRWLRRAAAASTHESCPPAMLFTVPKIVFLYPTGVVALICGALTDVWTDRPELIGGAFLVVFVLNLIVLGFEFPRATSLMFFCGALAIAFGAMLAEERWPSFFPFLHRLLGHAHPTASDQFYWLTGAALLLVIGLALIGARFFDYWEVRSNELIHHHWIAQTEARFPTSGLRITMEVTDIFEHGLLKSGRLILHPAGEAAIVLENVPSVNDRAGQIDRVLDHLDVHVVRMRRGRFGGPS
jgi:hypothetical protein